MEYDELVEYISTTRNESIPTIERELKALKNSHLKEGYVEDEDKSVKWNREFVENTNKEIDAKAKALQDKKNDLLGSIYNELTTYLIEYGEGSITLNDANRIITMLDDDDYYFNNGVYNTIGECENLADLIIHHDMEK